MIVSVSDITCVCVCVGQLQQSLLAFGRSTRKLIRDVMEEQQRALDVLSSQVKRRQPHRLMNGCV